MSSETDCPSCNNYISLTSEVCEHCRLFLPSARSTSGDESSFPRPSDLDAAYRAEPSADFNPYSPPEAGAQPTLDGDVDNWIFVATRAQRFIGHVIDTMYLFGCAFFGAFLEGLLFGDQAGATGWTIAFVIGLAVNLFLLARTGQTLGKMAVKTKVVNYEGHKPSWILLVFVRSLPFTLLGLLPFLTLIDALFIFRDQRQCLHDSVAGTLVLQMN